MRGRVLRGTALALGLAIALGVRGASASSGPPPSASPVAGLDLTEAVQAAARHVEPSPSPVVAGPTPQAGTDVPASHPSVRKHPSPNLLVEITHDMTMTAHPGGGRKVGVLPAGSKYYGVPMVAWVRDVSPNGRFGELAVPYSGSRRDGWIPLRGLRRETTWVTVDVDLSRHRLTVEKRNRRLFGFPAGTGSPSSSTPLGRYFVTDRVPFPSGSDLGSFAFGISGTQPNLPPGWSGGNQLAIHGTNDPSSIGTSTSAGCVRVSEKALHKLEPLLRLGTPVLIHR